MVGYQTVTPDTIAHYLGIKAGEPYDPEKIRSNFQTLWDVGLLENVTIEAERAASGVTIIVTIEERPMITSIEFKGNKKISVSQIKDRLREQKAELHAGTPLSLRDIAKVRAAIADYYTEQGYRSVRSTSDRGRLQDRQEGRLRNRRGRQDQDRVDPLQRQQGLSARWPCATP